MSASEPNHNGTDAGDSRLEPSDQPSESKPDEVFIDERDGNGKHASFRKHGGWALAGRLLNIAVVASSSFVFARVMASKGDFGTFTFMQSTITLLGLVAGVGSGTAAIRLIAEAEHRGECPSRVLQVIAKALAVAAIGAGCLASLGIFTWAALGNAGPRVPTGAIVIFVGIAIAARGTHQFFAGAARAHSRLKTANLLDGANGGPISNGLLLISVLAIAVFVPVSWQAAAVALAIANTAAGIAGVYLLKSLVYPSKAEQLERESESNAGTIKEANQAEMLRHVLSIGVPVAATSLVFFLVEQVDLLYAGWALNENDLADYSAAKRISLILRMPFAMVNMAVTGVISRFYIAGKRDHLQGILSGTATLAFAASLVIAIPLMVAPRLMLDLGFGQGYADAATTMLWLLVGQLVIVMGGSCQQALILTEHQNSAMKVNFVAAILFIGSLFAFAGASPERVAMCFTGTTITRAAVMWWIARKRLQINTAPSRIGARWVLRQASSLPVLRRYLG